jgi:hypothetical protein
LSGIVSHWKNRITSLVEYSDEGWSGGWIRLTHIREAVVVTLQVRADDECQYESPAGRSQISHQVRNPFSSVYSVRVFTTCAILGATLSLAEQARDEARTDSTPFDDASSAGSSTASP